MNKQEFLQNISKVHDIFNRHEAHYNSLSNGVNSKGKQRDILDDFLENIEVEKNAETYYAAAARIGDKKFEPLGIYLEKSGASRARRDEVFESSYKYVRNYYEKHQQEMLDEMKEQKLLPEFYQTIFDHTHTLGMLYSDLFVLWNRKLLFETNRGLEARFENDQDAINAFIEENNLMDTGHRGESADRTYSILMQQ